MLSSIRVAGIVDEGVMEADSIGEGYSYEDLDAYSCIEGPLIVSGIECDIDPGGGMWRRMRRVLLRMADNAMRHDGDITGSI